MADPRRPSDKPVKRPYHPPRLERYGNLRELARNVGTTSTVSDGGAMGTNKTH